jgi:hypothetical protein
MDLQHYWRNEVACVPWASVWVSLLWKSMLSWPGKGWKIFAQYWEMNPFPLKETLGHTGPLHIALHLPFLASLSDLLVCFSSRRAEVLLHLPLGPLMLRKHGAEYRHSIHNHLLSEHMCSGCVRGANPHRCVNRIPVHWDWARTHLWKQT